MDGIKPPLFLALIVRVPASVFRAGQGKAKTLLFPFPRTLIHAVKSNETLRFSIDIGIVLLELRLRLRLSA